MFKAEWRAVARTRNGATVWHTLAKDGVTYANVWQYTHGEAPKSEAGYFELNALLRLRGDAIEGN